MICLSFAGRGTHFSFVIIPAEVGVESVRSGQLFIGLVLILFVMK